MSIFNKPLEFLVKKYVNSQIKDYGEMLNLNIDSQNKNITIEVLLKGEKENIKVHINKYEIVSKGNNKFIKFNNISASREWIETLIRNIIIPEYAPKKVIEIDSKYASILELLI